MATLWDKFKTAIRWITSAQNDAGIAIMHVADAPEPEKLLDGVSSTGSAPTQSTDGVSVVGLRTVNLYYRHSTSGDTSKADLYLYDGDSGEANDEDRWFRWGEVSLDSDEGIFDPFDLEGNWERIAAVCTSAPSGGGGGSVTMKCSPHSESGNTD